MPHGCRTRRTTSKFASILVALTLAAGCQRLSVSRMQPLAMPPSPSKTVRPEASAPTPLLHNGGTPGPLVENEPEPARTSPREPKPTPIATEGRPLAPATPLLDAAFERAKAEEAARRELSRDDTPRPKPDEPQPGERSRNAPEAAVQSESETESESGSGSEPRPQPRVVSLNLTPSVPAAEPKQDLKVEATESLVPERIDEPDGAARPINPDKPVAPAKPRDVWREGLDRLRSVACDHADVPGGDVDGAWALRARLLDWLDDPDSLAISDDKALSRSVLSSLAATIGPEPAEASARSATIRAAVDALEARAPLEITELQLCRKVRGFGDFEPLEALACRPGHGVIVYCEVAGLRYESVGPLQRSRLASRVEVVAPSGGEPLCTYPLGTADDLCRRRRRDYYVNYRITLPESLPPGPYELRLVQDDLVANHSASRAVPIVIQP